MLSCPQQNKILLLSVCIVANKKEPLLWCSQTSFHKKFVLYAF